MNLETAQLEFFIVVEAPKSREALVIADRLIDRALAAVEAGVQWDETHARQADLVPEQITYYGNGDEARAGAAPLRQEDYGYAPHLDRTKEA